MEARIHVLTLAVSDLERALSFYRDGLGFDSAGVIGTEFVGDDDNASANASREALSFSTPEASTVSESIMN
jgi:catechol 2,3-dioxygenase-like lactoylglutathione lyase family enzyme